MFHNDAGQGRRKLLMVLLESIVLLGFWFVLVGRLELSDLVLGGMAVAGVVWMSHGLVYPLFLAAGMTRSPAFILVRIWHGLAFMPWFLYRILIANLQVAYLVLHPRIPISPLFVQFPTGLRKHLAQVMIGNCITLTPGTITVELDAHTYTVHVLAPPSASDVLTASLQNRVARIFGEDVETPPAPRWASRLKELAQ